VNITAGAHYPQVYAEGGLRYTDSAPATMMDATTYYGGVFLQVPIFEGGLMKAEVAESRSRQRQAELSTELLKRSIQAEVADAYIQYQAVTTVLETTKNQFDYAKRNFDSVEGLFADGLVPSLSVIDAQQALFLAERELVTATFEQQLAVLRLQKAVGLLGKQQ
jgi:outer membrane protein TolC